MVVYNCHLAVKTLLLFILISNPFFIKGQSIYEISNIKVNENLPWSERMAETMILDYPKLASVEDKDGPKWEYTYGLLDLAYIKLWEATANNKYYNYAREYIDYFISEDGVIKTYKKNEYNLDKINPGKVLYTLYNKTGEQKYKIALDTLRQQLREQPRTNSGGFWHKKKYENQMWLDGLYMGAPFYAQYAKEFNEPECFEDIGHWIVLMEKVARDPKTGLLYHGWDESKKEKWSDPENGLSPNFWGRGMGWYGMALVDVLDFFPENNIYYDSIRLIIDRMAEAIVKVQDKNTGLWFQVLDKGNQEENYLEGSVSTMFCYFLLKSVDKGYISKKYLDFAEKAYQGILKNLITVKPDGRLVISPVCAVAGLGGKPYRDGSFDYYVHEKKRDNDSKAVGPFIMASLFYEKIFTGQIEKK
jgi:unsaturated rhamnogalacturonyl hydrolase